MLPLERLAQERRDPREAGDRPLQQKGRAGGLALAIADEVGAAHQRPAHCQQ